MKKDTKIILGIIAIAIILRIILLFIAPVSMFADAVIRHLPNAEKLLELNFSFYDFPLLAILEAFLMLFFSGKFLWFASKSISFILFVAILSLLPSIFKKFNLNKKEQIIAVALFLFSTWSLLLSVTIMQEMMLTFFVLALFISLEKYLEKPKAKWALALIFITASMIFAKQTGYLIAIGFGLYILGKKAKWKVKIKSIFYIAIGALLTLFWPIKNYITTGKAFIGVKINSIFLHSIQEYWNSFVLAYHYFWEIPLPIKTALTGNFAIMYNIYYLAAIFTTAFVSIIMIFTLFRYSKKYKECILLMLPLFAFAFGYWAFLLLLSGDVGRYTFPLWIFLFIFTAKYIEGIKNKFARGLCYLAIVAFCIISIISAFGITLHMHQIDSQILQINTELQKINATGTFITNDEFTSSALSYYLEKPVIFNLTRNVRDAGVPCQGEHIFFTKNFDVFMEAGEYRICRW